MGKKHQHGPFEKARDRLYSEIQRCDVLEADDDLAEEWLDDAIEYLGERFPRLSQLEMHQLGQLGRNYVAPAIPHGAETTALNREEWEDEATEAGDAVETDDAIDPELTPVH